MKISRSFIVSFVLLSVLSISILAVSADFITIDPDSSTVDGTENYIGTMTIPYDSYYLRLDIPNGFVINTGTNSGDIVGTFTISDKVTIQMYSTGSNNVVWFGYLINDGPITNIPGTLDLNKNDDEIAHITNTLKFHNNNNIDRYLEFLLTTLGPIKGGSTVTVDMTDGILKNPSTAGDYYWNAAVTGGATVTLTGGATVTITGGPTITSTAR